MSEKSLKIERSICGLRDMLFVELENFRSGKCSVNRARTVINFSREIIQATRIEIVQSAILLEKQKNGKNPTLQLK